MSELEKKCPAARAGVCMTMGASWCVAHTGPDACDCAGYRRLRELLDSSEAKGFAAGVAVVVVLAVVLHLIG